MTADPVIKRTICIMDDDQVIRLTTQELILKRMKDCRLIIFPDGEQALHYFKENLGIAANLPQLIFVDINMPVLNEGSFWMSSLHFQMESTLLLSTSSARR